jgi:hypothetical protein
LTWGLPPQADRFSVQYYDELGRQDSIIEIGIENFDDDDKNGQEPSSSSFYSFGGNDSHHQSSSSSFEPVGIIEKTLCTKWRKAKFSWLRGERVL